MNFTIESDYKSKRLRKEFTGLWLGVSEKIATKSFSNPWTADGIAGKSMAAFEELLDTVLGLWEKLDNSFTCLKILDINHNSRGSYFGHDQSAVVPYDPTKYPLTQRKTTKSFSNPWTTDGIAGKSVQPLKNCWTTVLVLWEKLDSSFTGLKILDSNHNSWGSYFGLLEDFGQQAHKFQILDNNSVQGKSVLKVRSVSFEIKLISSRKTLSKGISLMRLGSGWAKKFRDSKLIVGYHAKFQLTHEIGGWHMFAMLTMLLYQDDAERKYALNERLDLKCEEEDPESWRLISRKFCRRTSIWSLPGNKQEALGWHDSNKNLLEPLYNRYPAHTQRTQDFLHGKSWKGEKPWDLAQLKMILLEFEWSTAVVRLKYGIRHWSDRSTALGDGLTEFWRQAVFWQNSDVRRWSGGTLALGGDPVEVEDQEKMASGFNGRLMLNPLIVDHSYDI
ncbi:hypothetical protein M5K25_019133 [Dendrobium thyrsiflorum]|uniref:Uncharacterized protein n=1 Tax=Dendrobium thyrsiflorum TaxID=117978 RepID=A0ABD0UEV9_DENTH